VRKYIVNQNVGICLENNRSVILWRNLWSSGRQWRKERHGTWVCAKWTVRENCEEEKCGNWGGFDCLWSMRAICCLLSVGRMSQGKCCWRCSLLGRDNARAWKKYSSVSGVSISSRLHGATFQKTDVRGSPLWGTSSRNSFLKLSLLPFALYRNRSNIVFHFLTLFFTCMGQPTPRIWFIRRVSGQELANGIGQINPLKTKRRLLYLKTQSVPRCKHFSSRL